MLWTPGVLAHLYTSRRPRRVQKWRWTSLKMLRNYYTLRCPDPPPTRTSALELTCASPRSTILVRDRSHARDNRIRTCTGRIHHQVVTGSRYTGLTITFSRPAESRLDTHTASEVEHTRSVLRSAVGRFSLDPAHHPCHAGAGAGCALSRPSCTASLAQRLRFCDN